MSMPKMCFYTKQLSSCLKPGIGRGRSRDSARVQESWADLHEGSFLLFFFFFEIREPVVAYRHFSFFVSGCGCLQE